MTCLQELMSLWSDMAQLLNEEHLDPTYYSVFRGLVEDWTARSTRANLSSIVTLVSSELHRLSNSVVLLTGNSMPIIWETVRPSIPSNLEQWNAYDRLRALTSKFDDMVEGQIGKSELVKKN
jgi:midasin (ATPase involved in ribosome maturation)